jgi:transposase
MPVGGLDSYFMRWSHPETEGDSLEEALVALIREWYGAPGLARHHVPGNLVITLQMGGRAVTFEITDETVLRDYMGNQRSVAVIEYLAQKMGVSPDVAMTILEDVDKARVVVDTLWVPDPRYKWEPGVNPDNGLGAPPAEDELPKAALSFIGDRLAQEDRDSARGRGRRRTALGQDLLKQIIVVGRQQGLSDAEISRRSGVPRSTIRDARHRMERQERARVQFGLRRPGERLTSTQRDQVIQAIREAEGNASKAARDLGLPPRTVREIRQKHRQAMASPAAHVVPAPTRARYTPSQKGALLGRMRDLMVNEGLTATEAGRRVGVKDRTARGWVHRERRRGLD